MANQNTIREEWNDISEFFRKEKVDDNKLGLIFKEYVEESVHGGWECFSSHDVTGIRRFLSDFIMYYNEGSISHRKVS